MASWEHGNEPAGSILDGEFLDQLSDNFAESILPAPYNRLHSDGNKTEPIVTFIIYFHCEDPSLDPGDFK